MEDGSKFAASAVNNQAGYGASSTVPVVNAKKKDGNYLYNKEVDN